MKLTLRTPPDVPLEAEAISPAALAEHSASEVAKMPALHGNREVELGEFFAVEGSWDGTLRLEGDLSGVKLIGAGMSEGEIIVDGSVGSHLAAGMTGGEIKVKGDAGDWVGREMSGGRIVIEGSAGHLVGSATRGSHVGIRGGEIIIHGDARNEVGNGMRRGLIVVGGEVGDFAGVNMLAGSIVVLGKLGARPGAGMKRGTIVSMNEAELLPTFTYTCGYEPMFLRIYLLYLQALGLPIDESQVHGKYRRWSGDSVELNRGEILLLER